MEKLKIFLLLLVMLYSGGVAAQEIEFKGFASVGLGIFSEDDSEFNGVDDSLTSDPFNLFALQAKATINEKTAVTAQLIARGQGQAEDDYEVEAQWLYVTLKATDNTNVRIGRFRSPLYYYSDFIDVAYSYPWITPPDVVYSLVGLDSVEGLDIVNNHSMGDWDGTFQFFYGGYSDETFVFDDYGGINYTASYDWLTLRAGYVINGSSTTNIRQLNSDVADAIAGIALADPDLAEALDTVEEKVEFTSLATLVDYNDWLFTFEMTILDFDEQSLFSDSDSWYAMVGRRHGSVTYHLTYGESENDPDLSIVNPLLPLEIQLGATGLINAFVNETSNTILGARWDYAASSAVKFEITQVDDKIGDEDGTLYAISIDTVF